MSLFPALLSASSRRRSDGATLLAYDTSKLTFSAALDLGGAENPGIYNTIVAVSNAATDAAVMIVQMKLTHTKTIDNGQSLTGESGGVAYLAGVSLYDYKSPTIIADVSGAFHAFAASCSNRAWLYSGLTSLSPSTRFAGSVVVNQVCGYAFDPTLVGGSAGPTSSSSGFYAGFTDQCVDVVGFKFSPGTTVLYDFTTPAE